MRSRSLLAYFVLLSFAAGCDEGSGLDSVSDSGFGLDAGLDLDSGLDLDAGFVPPDATTCAVYLWEPGDGELETWPSMEYLVSDKTTATGYSFSMTEAEFPGLSVFGANAHIAEEQLPAIDGFGIHGAHFAEFSRPFEPDALPAADGLAHTEDPAGIVVFAEDGTTSLHPVSITTAPDKGTDQHLLVATPMVPLPELSWAAFFVTNGAANASVDSCVSPSAGMYAEIEDPNTKQTEAIKALIELGVIEEAHDLVVLQPFITESIFAESLAVAADIESRPDEDFDLVIDPATDCTVGISGRHCVATLTATDYRNADGYLELDAYGGAIRQSTYVLDVHLWLPKAITGPSPVFVLGHAIGTDIEDMVSSAAGVFSKAIAEGVIVVGIDSLEHGTHPTSETTASITEVMNFFTIDLANKRVDALRLRENLRQSTYDKLQLTRAILANPDLDGDGTEDVDPAKLGYVGVSLGAIMGPELLALTDAYDIAVLSMPGGRVSDIINDPASRFAPFKSLVLSSAVSASPAETTKIFTILQTALDRGDPASYAGHLLRDRFDFAPRVPDVLVMNVIDDDVIPNPENWYFARSMGIDVAPTSLVPVPGLGTIETTPVTGNVVSLTGAVTAGLLQFDLVELDSGEVVAAEHGNMTQSVTGRTAIFEFLDSKWSDGAAVIVDPYAIAGLSLLSN